MSIWGRVCLGMPGFGCKSAFEPMYNSQLTFFFFLNLPFGLFQKCSPNPSVFTSMPHTCGALKILMLTVTFHEAKGTEMPLK